MPFAQTPWGRLLALLVVAGLLAALVGVISPVVRAAAAPGDQATRTCMSNIKALATAVNMYAQDNGQRFPLAKSWTGVLARRYIKRMDALKCPKAPGISCGYAYNANLNGQRLMSVPKPKDTVLLFESDKGWNASGESSLLTPKPRHNGGQVVAFADGHAEWKSVADCKKLKFKAR